VAWATTLQLLSLKDIPAELGKRADRDVRLSCYFISAPTNYAWQLSDPNHLILTSVQPDPPKPGLKHKPAKPAAPFTPAVLTLTRTPTPARYPLLERGFHFISEWRYER
jgi:hypothetical protein